MAEWNRFIIRSWLCLEIRHRPGQNVNPGTRITIQQSMGRSIRCRSVDKPCFGCYFFLRMSAQELTANAMALSLADRVVLAQTLWESIDVGLPDMDEGAAMVEAVRRDNELSSGAVAEISHEEVLQAARTAIGCA